MKDTLFIKVFMGAFLVACILLAVGFMYTAYQNGKTDSEKNKKKKIIDLDNRLTKVILNGAGVLVTFAFCIASIVLLAIDLNTYVANINTDFRKEKATFVSYQQVETNNVCYNLLYEFVADDGTIYKGQYPIDIANFDYVESKIGKDITIYVDYDSKTHLLDTNFTCTYSYVFGGCAVLSLSLFCYLLFCFVKLFKKYSEVPEKDVDIVYMARSKRPANYLPLHLIVIIVALIVAIYCLAYFVNTNKDLEINRSGNFVQEEATIAFYERKMDGDLAIFPVYYEYVSNDMTYIGCLITRPTNEDEVRAMLGNKVPIYIEHNLQRQSMTLDFDTTNSMIWAIFGAGVLIALSVLSLTKIIIYCKKYIKYYKQYNNILKKYGLGN